MPVLPEPTFRDLLLVQVPEEGGRRTGVGHATTKGEGGACHHLHRRTVTLAHKADACGRHWATWRKENKSELLFYFGIFIFFQLGEHCCFEGTA